jgi:DNA-binding CsgD family transcriptional regulator
MTATRPVPPHGTTARYQGTETRPPCRCRKCTTAAVRADQLRELDRLAGRPRTIDAAPVRAHIDLLVSSGLSYGQIARAAGINDGTVGYVREHEQVRRSTAEKILAVRPGYRPESGPVAAGPARARVRELYALEHEVSAIAQASGLSAAFLAELVSGRTLTVSVDTDDRIRAAWERMRHGRGQCAKNRHRAVREGWIPTVDAVGSRRRLQALQRMGHSQTALVDATGLRRDWLRIVLHGPAERVSTADADAIRRAYLHLIQRPGTSARAANRALELGWHGPAAWDDIDNPAAEPETCGTTARKTIRDRARERAEEIQHLAGFGLSDHAIAEQLGMSPKYVHDLLAGHRVTGQRELRKAA